MAANERAAQSLLGKFGEQRELDRPQALLSRLHKSGKSANSAFERVI